MRVPSRLLMLALLVALAAAPVHAQDTEECPNSKGWRPSPEVLQAKLQAHGEWLDKGGRDNLAVPGRAILCNADLTKAQLQGADLTEARLQGANLEFAQLQGANLEFAQLQGANLVGAQLQDAWLQEAQLQGAPLVVAQLQGANLTRAQLQGANLVGAQLQDADLRWAELQDAELRQAQLQGAYLFEAQLQGADLARAELQGANLRGAQLDRVNLEDADLSRADLRRADLHFASLHATNLEDTKLSGATLLGAMYEATAAPARGYLTDLRGLTAVHFRPGQSSGLVLLRARLAEAGLRDLEREATFALERQTTRHKLQAWREQPWSGLRMGLESAFRWLAFELPVAYGLYPGRALLILLGFILVFSVPYMVALVNPLTRDAGIWRVWAEDRVVRLQEQNKPERLEVDWYWEGWRTLYRLPLHALQFSILSAFHIGFRELNVGNWLARLQPREYVLKATGWVRVVAGLQSLFSVYLLALWALTYFGRPFG